MDPLLAAQVATGAVQDVLYALAIGGAACLALLRQAGVNAPALPTRRGSAWAWGGLLLASLAALWWQTMLMAGTTSLSDTAGALGSVLHQSHYGRAWLLGCMGLLLALRGSLGVQRSPTLMVFGALAYVAGKAATSHAADSGDFSLAEIVHAVHLLATALWAGGVMAAVYLLRRGALPFGTPGQGAAFRVGLSKLATWALVVVVATGIFNALRDTAHAGASWFSTGWGYLLIAKIVLVTLALMLAGQNRLDAVPALRRALHGSTDAAACERAAHRFDRWLACEAVVMLLILIVAAALGHTSPDLVTGS